MIKVIRIEGTQKYKPFAICSLCGEPITDGSATVIYDGEPGGVTPRMIHLYDHKRTCKYKPDTQSKRTMRAAYLPACSGIPLVEFIADLLIHAG